MGWPRSDTNSQGQVVVSAGKVALDGAQLIAGDRMLHRQGILQASHPQPRALQVDVVAAKCNCLRHTQPVSIQHQHQQMVACPVPSVLGTLEQAIDLAGIEEVLAALVALHTRFAAGAQTSNWHRSTAQRTAANPPAH